MLVTQVVRGVVLARFPDSTGPAIQHIEYICIRRFNINALVNLVKIIHIITMVSSIMAAKRVTGQQLAQHLNNDVIILGQVKKVSSSGKSVELLTTDNVSINVSLPEPIDGNCEGYIEVRGTALSKSTLQCKSYVHFPPEMSDNFESDKYNAFLLTLHVLGDKKWKISADEDPY